jgi:chloramphenicol-sensitive protein RarD
MKKGILAAVAVYTMWDITDLLEMAAICWCLEILGHRIIWSFFLLAIVIMFRPDKLWIQDLLHTLSAASGLSSRALLGVNWLTYIFAVNNGFIVESSWDISSILW